MGAVQEDISVGVIQGLVDRVVEEGSLCATSRVERRLLDMCRDEDTTTEEVISLVSSQPDIADGLMRLANAGGKGGSGTLPGAVQRFGPKAARTLALGLALASHLPGAKNRKGRHRNFWTYALTTACAARAYAQVKDGDRSEDAFLAGLLQDIGMLAFCRARPEDYRCVLKFKELEPRAPLHKVERRTMGLDHMELGRALLKQWRLPADIYEPIRYHHCAEKARKKDVSEKRTEMAGLLELSDLTSRMIHQGTGDTVRWALIYRADRVLGLSRSKIHEVLNDIESLIHSAGVLSAG